MTFRTGRSSPCDGEEEAGKKGASHCADHFYAVVFSNLGLATSGCEGFECCTLSVMFCVVVCGSDQSMYVAATKPCLNVYDCVLSGGSDQIKYVAAINLRMWQCPVSIQNDVNTYGHVFRIGRSHVSHPVLQCHYLTRISSTSSPSSSSSSSSSSISAHKFAHPIMNDEVSRYDCQVEAEASFISGHCPQAAEVQEKASKQRFRNHNRLFYCSRKTCTGSHASGQEPIYTEDIFS